MDKKYRLENFSPTDAEGIQKHLSNMAAKGWQLESIGNFLWSYQRIEPAAHIYAVIYRPVSADSKVLEEYRAYCEAAGWHWVASWAQVHIFYTENPSPVPLETDESVKLEAIRVSLRTLFLPIYLVLLALFLAATFFTTWRVLRDPIQSLTDGTTLLAPLLMFLGAGITGWNLLAYGLWTQKAKRAAAMGGPCPSMRIRTRWLFWIALPLVLVYWALLLKNDFARHGSWLRVVAGNGVFLYGVGWLLLTLILDIRDVSRKKRLKTLTVLAAVILCSLLLLQRYTQMNPAPLRSDVPPVGVMALWPEAPQFYHVSSQSSQGMLLESQQWTVRNVDTGVQSCTYTIHRPAFPWVQTLCLRQLSQAASDATEVAVPGTDGALVWTQDGADCGLLWSESTIVEYCFQEPPSTGEPSEIMVEALKTA